MKWLVAVVLAALLVAGCGTGRPVTVAPGGQAPSLPEAQAGPQGPKGPKVEILLPPEGWVFPFTLSDGPAVAEQFLRDGERLIGTQNGKAYVTWFVTDSGIWRPDPNGPGLLRYLPPVLQDNLAWKQTSGDATIWFALHQRHGCTQDSGLDEACWELTVLNRQERTTFRFVDTRWIFEVLSENLANPQASYPKRLVKAQPADQPLARDPVLQAGAQRPPGDLPAITVVTPAEFAATVQAALEKAGRPTREIDLDADGTPERIEGTLGEWTDQPIRIFRQGQDQPLWETAAHSTNRVQVINLPGFDRPTLLWEGGKRDTWHSIGTLWLRDNQVQGAYGWAPKVQTALGANVAVEPDGTIVVTNNPADMAGYTWTRRYRITPVNNQPKAELVVQNFQAGAYPTTAADVLTAMLIADWYGLDADFARYLPDPAQRQAVRGYQQLARPMYYPDRAALGHVVKKTAPNQTSVYAEVQPTPIGPDGSTEFLVQVGEYEGAAWTRGTVTFGKAADGRLVVQHIEFLESGWGY